MTINQNTSLATNWNRVADLEREMRIETPSGGPVAPPVADLFKPPPDLPRVIRLGDLVAPSPNDESVLIGNRYLCRGGGMLLVGSTGIGKSALAMQMAISFSLPKECLGFEPKHELRSLIIQAENDDGDLYEERNGIYRGLSLNQSELQNAGERVCICTINNRNGAAFLTTLNNLMQQYQPDIVWIDPVLSFLGADASSQRDVGVFLRNGLQPILSRRRCGVVLCHHTMKPPRQDVGNRNMTDYAYTGLGSVEWSNWSRAIISLEKTNQQGVFTLHAGKRGDRLNWRDSTGSKVYKRTIAHSAQGIFWEDRAIGTGPEPNVACDKEYIRNKIGEHEQIDEDVLVMRCCAGVGSGRKTKALIKEMVADGSLFRWSVPRPGTRPAVKYAKERQPGT